MILYLQIVEEGEIEVIQKSPKQNTKRVNPKEVVFLDEESDSSSKASDDDGANPIIDLVEHASSSGSADSAINLEDLGEEEESGERKSDLDEEEGSDGREFDLDDAAQYFNRQNGEVRCRKCGNVGHLAAECPLGPSQEPCIQCASVHHQVKTCPFNICRQSVL